MMQLRILAIIAFLLVSCVDARSSRIINRWREGKKGNKQLRGDNPEPVEVEEPKPEGVAAAAIPAPEAKGDVSTSKQPVSQFATKIGDPLPAAAGRDVDKPEIPEPALPNASGMHSNMGMYHAMGPPGMGPPGMGGQGQDIAIPMVAASAYGGFWCGPRSTPAMVRLREDLPTTL